MSSQSNWFWYVAVSALALAVSAPKAVGGVPSCPTGSVPTTNYATANLGSSASTFRGQSASVLCFDNFQAVLGSTIDFNWNSSFDALTEGYVFALLDGQKSVLTEVTSSDSLGAATPEPATTSLIVLGLAAIGIGVFRRKRS